MKYFIVLLSLLLFGCESDRAEVLSFISKGIAMHNESIIDSKYDYLNKFEAAMLENPRLTETTKIKTDSLHKLSDEIIDNIDTLKKHQTKTSIKSLKHYKACLYSSIRNFDSYIDSLNKVDTTGISRNLKLEKYSKQEVDSFSLNLIANSVQVCEYKFLKHYYGKMPNTKTAWKENIAVVIPKKNKLKPGELFEAKIFLSTIDTVYEQKLKTKNKDYISKKGRFYIKRSADEIGRFKIPAVLSINQPKTGKALHYPFNIKYKVIEKP